MTCMGTRRQCSPAQQLLVQAQTGCPGSESLMWFDPVTSGVTVVLSAPGDVQGVVGAIPYGG